MARQSDEGLVAHEIAHAQQDALDNVMAQEHDAIRALSREEFERQFMATASAQGTDRRDRTAVPGNPSKTDLSARIVAPAVDVPG